MSTILLTFLGTGNYQSCRYQIGDEPASEETFFSVALAEMVKPQKCICLQTSASSHKHGPQLAADFDRIGIQLSSIPIPEGKVEAELWIIFEALTEHVPHGATLHFDITHTIPCTWVLHFRVHVADDRDEGTPTGPLIADTWTSQAVTPNDAESVDYYYSWGAAKHCEFPGLSELLRDNLDDAFTEDRHVLEAQHIRIREKPDFQTVSIIHDVGPSRMLRLLDDMLRVEANDTITAPITCPDAALA